MDPCSRWRNLPSGPSLKHLTDPSYGIPREQQKAALQELTRAHVESFNYAVHEGLGLAVQAQRVSGRAHVLNKTQSWASWNVYSSRLRDVFVISGLKSDCEP
uniref:RNA polymerase I subunit B n=1 Tax=Callithrix jacchus TaxID=9483 RepID=A0A8I3WT06_CALJA